VKPVIIIAIAFIMLLPLFTIPKIIEQERKFMNIKEKGE